MEAESVKFFVFFCFFKLTWNFLTINPPLDQKEKWFLPPPDLMRNVKYGQYNELVHRD